MSRTTVPFQTIVPSKSMSIWMTSGRSRGGGWLVCGMSSFVACVMTGIDMISTMMSTSITSMSGVVLISIIGAPSPPLPTLIAMKNYLE